MGEFKVGVVGLGFVGGALKRSFESRGQSVIAYDKYKECPNEREELLETNILFLCLPTQYVKGHGYDIGALQETCNFLCKNRYNGLVVIKSTVEIGTTKLLSETYTLNMCHNPEFLTARTAFEDFDNQEHIVIGTYYVTNKFRTGGESLVFANSGFILSRLYEELYPEAQISICRAEEAEAMKLFCNNFYAIKVQVFNEFYLLCQRIGADFETVRELMLNNGWINPMHTDVPGPDGSLSYGGACFPKDTSALNEFMKRMGATHEVLEACISERNKIRKD
jgi:UDPglucose 6-dehydrogenase